MARPKHRTKPAGTYFITTSTWERRPIFQNSKLAAIIPRKLIEYRDRGFFLVHGYVVMPDHIHVILTPSQTTSLEKTVQLIKGGSSHEMKKALKSKFPIWHAGFTEHGITDQDDFDRHVRYTHLNPVKARLVRRPEDYPFSSAAPEGNLDPWPGVSGAEARPRLRVAAAGLKPRPSESPTKAAQPGGRTTPAQAKSRQGNRKGASSAQSRPRFRVFAICDIGQDALDLLRRRGYEVEVYDQREPPPKSLIIDKVRSGIDGLITTLRDQIDAEVFEAGRILLTPGTSCGAGGLGSAGREVNQGKNRSLANLSQVSHSR
jgi:putative transposase